MNTLDMMAIVHFLILAAIALIFSLYSIRAIFAIKRHNFDRSISLAWGINPDKRAREIFLLGVGTIFFALHFLLALLNTTNSSLPIAISILFIGIIGYSIIGYFIYKAARVIGRL